MTRRHLAWAFGVVAATMSLSGSSFAADPVKPFVRAVAADVGSLDPADTRSSTDQDLLLNVYERLVEMKFTPRDDGALVGDAVAVVPDLAESWDVDGPVITFHLRHDVKFYPTGNPMTADDVVYSLQRLVSIPANGYNQATIAGLFTPDQIVKVDPYTVKITYMDGPNGKPAAVPVALTSMKFLQFAVLDSVEIKKHATADDPWARAWLQKNLATTGPYYIANRIPNQQIELKAVPGRTWGVQPGFDQLILRVTGQADPVSLIKGGVVDYAGEGLTGRQYDSLAAAGFPVLHSDIPDILKVSMASDKPPFTDKRVRQAMLYAIPIDQIIKTALAGRGVRSPCMYNPDDPTCDNSYAKYTYDLDKAKALLKEAGQEKFAFDFWYSNSLPYNNDIAIIIKNSLSQIGVTANLKPTPDVQLQTAIHARIDGANETMSGMYLHESTFWLADPATLTNTAFVCHTKLGGATNWSRYCDPDIDKAHYTYRNSTDVEARTAAYHLIQDKEADMATNSVPLIVMGRTIATSPRITGVTFSQEPYAHYVYTKPKK